MWALLWVASGSWRAPEAGLAGDLPIQVHHVDAQQHAYCRQHPCTRAFAAPARHPSAGKGLLHRSPSREWREAHYPHDTLGSMRHSSGPLGGLGAGKLSR